jgi:signal peptide peptidase SppA
VKYQHILGEIFNKPMLATPALMFDAVVFAKTKLGLNVDGFNKAQMGMYDDEDGGEPDNDDNYQNGIANIGVYGPLVARTGNLAMCSRMTAYESISQQFVEAINNPACLSIVFDMDTPGGTVSGAFDLANLIYANRGVKPIHAIVNHSAYSAGYLIASACDTISLGDTGGVGSIGVLMQHIDYSKMLAEEGIKVTTLTRGENKADGNPSEPLSEPALAEFNAQLDMFYGMFTNFVAKARNLSVDAVVNTQARCFYGQSAIAAGLADTLETPAQAIQRVYEALPKPVLFDPLAKQRMQAKAKLLTLS